LNAHTPADRVDAAEHVQARADCPGNHATPLHIENAVAGVSGSRSEDRSGIHRAQVPRSVEISAQQIHHSLREIRVTPAATHRERQHRQTTG
jgi:hypothetical protein